jgi:Na+/melibiose symporter-like transporter
MINPEHKEAAKDDPQSEDDVPFEDEIANNLPKGFRIVAVVWAIMVLISVLLIQKGPEDLERERQEQELQRNQNANGQISQANRPKRKNKSFRSVFKYLKTRQFVTLWLMTFLSINMSTFTIGCYADYATQYIDDTNMIVWIGSVGSVCTSLRFAWSFPLDYFPFKYVYGTMLCI